jgi:hypothetical protein
MTMALPIARGPKSDPVSALDIARRSSDHRRGVSHAAPPVGLPQRGRSWEAKGSRFLGSLSWSPASDEVAEGRTFEVWKAG